MALLRIAALAIASMFWPLLLVVVVIALESSRPTRVLVAFYIGGFLTATSVGTALVFALEDSPLMTGSRLPSAPWFDIVLGLLALAIAGACRRAHRHRLRERRASEDSIKRSTSKELIRRLVENGGPLVFAAGVVGSVVPSPLVILAMAEIAQLGYSTAATLVVIVAFFMIVFISIEVPIGGFAFAPEATRTLSLRAKSWLDGNMLWLASWALAIVGAFQVVRGTLSL